jgi:hypothetical protein
MPPRRQRDPRGRNERDEELRAEAEASQLNERDEELQAEAEASQLNERGEMGDQSSQFVVPTFEKVEPQKIYPIDIPKLGRSNCRIWKSQVKGFLASQGCWQVVEMVYNWRKKLHAEEVSARTTKLLESAAWSASNALAKIYLKKVIEEEDLQSVNDFRSAGNIYGFLMENMRRCQWWISHWRLTRFLTGKWIQRCQLKRPCSSWRVTIQNWWILVMGS